MPSIKSSVPHQLGIDEAKQRITRLITEAKGQLGKTVSEVEESWTENRGTFRFRAMGFSVSGHLQVESTTVLVEVSLPLAALPFRSRLENDLIKRAKELLA